MSEKRKKLLFVSPRFLFPVDSGGKIRTTQILRGLKGGDYEIVLVSPATPSQVERHRDAIDGVCDDFLFWPERQRGPLFPLLRLLHVVSALPIPIRNDWDRDAAALIAKLLADGPDVVVFDFLHSVVLAPETVEVPSVLFTHNVESEIFDRHQERATRWFMRALWRAQARKMSRFEASALSRFDVVVAVSERDGKMFHDRFGCGTTHVIPTGVDLDFFSFAEPVRSGEVVFCGSMDWVANQEAIQYFMDEIWPLVVAAEPEARMKVVGRDPPAWLAERASSRGLNWSFTGFVDDVRPHVQGTAVSVIPMNIAGGTRLKAYEALAMGSPLVSTSIGIEGLPLEDGTHCLVANDARSFADAVISLLRDRARRLELAGNARHYVQENFSYRVASASFAEACERARTGSP